MIPTEVQASDRENQMSIDGIRVDLACVAQAEGDFKHVLNSLRGELDQLDGKLRSNLGEWTGEAREAYTVYHARWRSAADEMVQNLAWLHGVIGTAHRNYHSTRATNLRMWRGGR